MNNLIIKDPILHLFICELNKFREYLKQGIPKNINRKEICVYMNTKEVEFGNKILKQYCERKLCYSKKNYTKQWTSQVCECIVKEILIQRGETPKKPKKIKDPDTGLNLQPDIETENAIYEVKGRCVTVPGTAGEKVLGTPFKYCNVPRLYKKRLNIVLVGYQEEEYKDLFDISKVSEERRKIIEQWNSINIYFMFASEMLKCSTSL